MENKMANFIIYRDTISYCRQCYELAQSATLADKMLYSSKFHQARLGALRSLLDESFDRDSNRCAECCGRNCPNPALAEFFER
jgi:hypothetical protein